MQPVRYNSVMVFIQLGCWEVAGYYSSSAVALVQPGLFVLALRRVTGEIQSTNKGEWLDISHLMSDRHEAHRFAICLCPIVQLSTILSLRL